MAFKYFDRVKETSVTTGTGAIALGGASTGFISFQSVYSNADTLYYCIQDQTGPNWEVGLGTYASSGNLLQRTTVLASSNAGSAVSFTSASLYIFATVPAAQFAGAIGTVTGTGALVLGTNPVVALGNGSTAVTQTAGDATTKPATTAFVNGTAIALAAGSTAVTQSSSDNSTLVATTAYVKSQAAPTAGGVGSIMLAFWATSIAQGGTTAGSNLTSQYFQTSGGTLAGAGNAMAGTWQALQTTGGGGPAGGSGLFQRTV